MSYDLMVLSGPKLHKSSKEFLGYCMTKETEMERKNMDLRQSCLIHHRLSGKLVVKK